MEFGMDLQQMKDDIFYIQGADTDYDVFRGGPGTDGADIIDLTGTTLTASIISASCFPGSNRLSVG
jgi:hypothetical protein